MIFILKSLQSIGRLAQCLKNIAISGKFMGSITRPVKSDTVSLPLRRFFEAVFGSVDCAKFGGIRAITFMSDVSQVPSNFFSQVLMM